MKAHIVFGGIEFSNYETKNQVLSVLGKDCNLHGRGLIIYMHVICFIKLSLHIEFWGARSKHFKVMGKKQQKKTILGIFRPFLKL